MALKKIDKIISFFLIFLLATLFINRMPFGEETIHGNYIFIGSDLEIIQPIIDNYIEYFNATILDTLPEVEVDLLIIFAHGNNNGSGIFLQYDDETVIYISDILATRAIYNSCSVGVMRSLDTDTEHYAYSRNDELDIGYYNSDGVYTWSSFFLEYVKNGTDWREAELLARQDIDILKLNVSRVTENILWGD